ncbi:MAG: ABC transporter ATP-binding protein, partial [Gemmiger sp.]
LIGPNGAGKTTVFNMLTGVYKPTEGNIVLDGKDITGQNPELISKSGIARTFQNIRLFNEMSVIDNVKVGLHNQIKYGMWTGILRLPAFKEKEHEMNREAMKLLKIFDLDKEANYKASQLPYGKQRKLEIARALATNPKLLLLDEPAAGMNPNETEELMHTIHSVRDQFGVAILLIEHDMNFVMGICEEITVLDYGRVIARGDGKSIRNNPKVIAAYLGGD